MKKPGKQSGRHIAVGEWLYYFLSVKSSGNNFALQSVQTDDNLK